ncbi:polyprotein [Moniliophthora roreri MCA 2997]|uniref:Polyprotein n=1 Tax=Moniliophthora roreri (strain MCA 2997) TaxID=1381753 RepID=V2W2C1_MONRO|nr:polyprotein [Moniliophthora roreri MCA 2997]
MENPPEGMPKLPTNPPKYTLGVFKNALIPPGIFDKVCNIIKGKIISKTYEPSNSSYHSRWFCVAKKDGKLHIVHSLELLNAVTIQHSGIPPATYELANHFAGRACGGTLDLFMGYNERKIHPSSWDLTTFQTPFGTYRLVKLPMGWTNSVSIFHKDVCEILKDEIPQVMQPYIDDVPICGPKTRYELEGGGYEMILENPGIRHFVWEHMQSINRILQHVKYCGGTFMGKKSFVCCDETIIVGHRCTYVGLKPTHNKMEAITTWPSPLTTKTDVRSFLGTCGQVRQFIKNFAKIAAPIQHLMQDDVAVEWGPKEEESMHSIKEALRNVEPLKPIDYESEGEVVLAVDTSYLAVGYYLYQHDISDKKKRNYCLFGFMTLNEREARFSQPKRELYGLKLALLATHYWMVGCRKLAVETDAKYIKGMLDNPSIAPNATINRWIEEIWKYYFTLIHIPAASHSLANGLSWRPPGGQKPAIHKLDPAD